MAQAPEHDAQPAADASSPNTLTLPLRPKKDHDPKSQPGIAEVDVEAGDEHDQGLAAGPNGASKQDEGSNAEDQDYGEVVDLPPLQPKKKKKRAKRKPQSQRGLGKPTGFEDFYADPPITPEQHAEEQQLYRPDLDFVDRILAAIARFERTRKMSNERRDMLYKYLVHGSVDVGPNSFQGSQATEDMDKTQAAATLSQASLSEDKRNLGTETSLYVVDFVGCMKGFLSRRAKYLYGFETRDQVLMLTTTLERFMDYLLQHDVCPEYRDDVLAARNLCRQAPRELWDVAEATRRLPGDFNIACSTLFGGSYAQNYDGETWWGPETTKEDQVFVGLKPEEAFQIVHFGVAGAATEEVYAAYLQGVNGGVESKSQLEVEWVRERVGFEVTKIEPPTKEGQEMYYQNAQYFRPVGRVYARPWKNPDALPEDLTPAERAALDEGEERKKMKKNNNHNGNGKEEEAEAEAEAEEYLFLLESILQTYLRVGTRVEATVRKLNCGLMFFDELIDVYPTFDEFLVNEMMAGWKKPRPVEGAFDYVEGGEYEDAFDGAHESDCGGEDKNDGADHTDHIDQKVKSEE